MNEGIIRSIVRQYTEPLRRRIGLAISRAVVSLVNDALKCQTVQVSLLANEVSDDVEHFQPFGLSSHPVPGAEAVYLSVGGARDHGIVVCVSDRRYRPTGLEAGETALYSTAGKQVHCKADGSVIVGNGATNFVALANLVMTELNKIATAFNAHTHVVSVPGVTTGPATVTATVAAPVSQYTSASVAATKVKAL